MLRHTSLPPDTLPPHPAPPHQVRSMKRARDIRDQLLGLMDRCEIELLSNPGDVGERAGWGKRRRQLRRMQRACCR
jgi:hypothetical protein